MKVKIYFVDAHVFFLCGKRTLKLWRSKKVFNIEVLEINLKNIKRKFRLSVTVIERKNRQIS